MGISLLKLAVNHPRVFRIVSDIDRTKLEGNEGPKEMMRVLKACVASATGTE